MLAPLRWLEHDSSLRLEVRIKKRIGDIRHFPVTCAVYGSPNGTSPLPLLFQRDDHLLSILFDRELKVGKKGSGVFGEGSDVEDATLPIIC